MQQNQTSKGHALLNEEFMKKVKSCLIDFPKDGQTMALISMDFDNFNYINDLYGYEIGDEVLERTSKHIESTLLSEDIFCRVEADHFLICLQPADKVRAVQLFLLFSNLKHVLSNLLPTHYTLSASGGIYIVKDNTIPLAAMIDKANCARKLSKGSADNSFHLYDEDMDEAANWKKQVTCMMESALKNNEFEMYLQPKVVIKTGATLGAEALVRWNSPKYGLIFPDRFIPILEQNGFIQRLDFFMLGEACDFLNKTKAMGIPSLSISVNFSKEHLQTEGLVERIFETVQNKDVEPNLIEIEFTETTLAANTQKLIQVVTDLKKHGFSVSLDDFGTAYSSLSYLKDLPIDIVKVDKGFLNSTADSNKGKVVLAKVVELIKSLKMLSVVEGVETKDQVDFLQHLNCDIAQGYFYARPMPKNNYLKFINSGCVVEDLEELTNISLSLEAGDDALNTAVKDFQSDNFELYSLGKNIDLGLMKGYLDGRTTVQYVNDRALEYLGYTRQEFKDECKSSIEVFTHPDDVHIVQKNLEMLLKTAKPVQFKTRAIRKDGKVIVLQGRSSCAMDVNGMPIGIYAFEDVTQQNEQAKRTEIAYNERINELELQVASLRASKEAFRLSEERYRIIVEQSDSVMFEWDFATGNASFSNKYRALLGREAHGTDSALNNPELRKYIHKDDLDIFENWIKKAYKSIVGTEATVRVQNATGEYLWMAIATTPIVDQNGNSLKIIGSLRNIQAQQALVEDLKIKAFRDPLTGLLNKTEFERKVDEVLNQNAFETGALFMMDVDNFKNLNDNLGHQIGDNVLKEIAQRIQNILSDANKNIVGRIGGDEFAVYLPSVTDQIAKEKAEMLAQSLHLCYFGSASKYEISGSIGIAYYPKHGKDFHDLYHNADIALYEAKKRGKNCYVAYNKTITTKLQDNRTPVEYAANFVNDYFKNDITFQAFGLLYDTKDVVASTTLMLEVLGKRFDVDRVFIFESSSCGQYFTNTYEWCKEGIGAQKQNLQKTSLKIISAFFSQYSKEGVYCLEDTTNTLKEVYDICQAQGIKSFLHCAIYKNGEQVGFIGFEHCTNTHKWTGEEIAVLGYISRIISVFMIKNDISLQLKTSYKNYASMMENLNGYVYVIDASNFEILFANRAIREELGIGTGNACYKEAYGIDEQCKECPVLLMNEHKKYASTEVYSVLLKKWINTAASQMKWEDGRDAYLISCTIISEKPSFYFRDSSDN